MMITTPVATKSKHSSFLTVEDRAGKPSEEMSKNAINFSKDESLGETSSPNHQTLLLPSEVESSKTLFVGDGATQSGYQLYKAKTEENSEKKRARYLGIVLAIGASSMFALAALFVKLMPMYHSFCVTFWRFFGLWVLVMPIAVGWSYCLKTPIHEAIYPPNTKERATKLKLLILRCFIGTLGISFQYGSLQYITIGDCMVVSFSTPVFVTILAHFILGEKLGVVPILLALMTILGVGIVTRPPILTGKADYDVDTLIGIGLACGCMLMACCNFILLRKLRTVHFAIMIAFFSTWGSIQTLIATLSTSTLEIPANFNHWVWAVSIGATTLIAQVLITISFKFEQASTISLCRTCDVVFAFLWQFIFLKVLPDIYSLVGAIIVISGVLISAFRKWLLALPEENKYRKKFALVLK